MDDTDLNSPQSEMDHREDRFLIIPLIIRVSQYPKSVDNKKLTRITPDDVIDFYQQLESFSGDLSSLLLPK